MKNFFFGFFGCWAIVLGTSYCDNPTVRHLMIPHRDAASDPAADREWMFKRQGPLDRPPYSRVKRQ